LRRRKRRLEDNSIEVVQPEVKKVVSVKLDVELIEQLDKCWRRHGYRSRSEFIREAILFYIQYKDAEAEAAKRREEGSEADEALKDLEELLQGLVI